MDVGVFCGGAPRDRIEARRRRIIDAARMLFVNNGFHATGVAQIARESGVAVGQIYRDFEAKEDIVAAIVEGDCHAFLEREALDRAVAEHDEPAVWAWLDHFVRPKDSRGTESLFAEIIAEAARNARIAAIFVRTQAAVIRDLHAALAFLAPGDERSDRRAVIADMVLTQSLGLKQQRLLRPGFDADDLVDMIVRIIAREIGTLTSRDR